MRHRARADNLRVCYRKKQMDVIFNASVLLLTIGSLSTRVFETRTATGSELFSLLTCLHTTAFALPSIFSALEMLGIKIWETPLSWHAKCPLPVVVRVSKTCVLKLPNEFRHNIVKVVCGSTRLSPRGSTATLTIL